MARLPDPTKLPGGAMLLPVYVPTALLAFGQGVLVPTLPVYALSLHASFGLVSLIVAAAGIGTFSADVPTGFLLGRLGRRPVMLLGAALVAASTLGIGLVPHIPALVALRLVAGVGTAMWGLSRHAYITDVTVPAQRGRAISVFGGINRAGNLAAPALGGVVAQAFGLDSPFFLAGGLAALTAFVALLVVPETMQKGAGAPGHRMRWGLVAKMLRTNWRDVSAAGVAQVFGQMIRAGRQLLIPLFGKSALGLDVAAIGTIISIGAAFDVAMFVPAGITMDRFGRKVATVPSFAIMAVGMALMSFATDYRGLLAAAVVIGFGNGLGSGTMMTLGADLAPPGAVGEFLGFWRLIGDTGQSGGPLIVGQVADAFGLPVTALVLCGIGLTAALAFAFLVRETRAGPASPARRAAP
ncbi:MAG TPA: MFS transporter [Thermomicrobiales bacterium]|nr:MFS transporter [Thermomicrobiales bacterium]